MRLQRRGTPKSKYWAIGSPGMPLPPRTGRGSSPPSLAQVLAEEGGDRVERGARGAFLVVDIHDLDIAPGLAVVRDEPLGLVSGEVGIVVVVVVHDVWPALHPERGRGWYLFAALEQQHRVALRHRGFGLPVGVVLFLHADAEGRRVWALL